MRSVWLTPPEFSSIKKESFLVLVHNEKPQLWQNFSSEYHFTTAHNSERQTFRQASNVQAKFTTWDQYNTHIYSSSLWRAGGFPTSFCKKLVGIDLLSYTQENIKIICCDCPTFSFSPGRSFCIRLSRPYVIGGCLRGSFCGVEVCFDFVVLGVVLRQLLVINVGAVAPGIIIDTGAIVSTVQLCVTLTGWVRTCNKYLLKIVVGLTTD